MNIFYVLEVVQVRGFQKCAVYTGDHGGMQVCGVQIPSAPGQAGAAWAGLGSWALGTTHC